MVEPQVCRTAVMPMRAPRCLGRPRSAKALKQEIVDHDLVLVGDIDDGVNTT
jgi:hypothetical protein